MKKLALTLIAGMLAFNVYALDDADGFRIIQKGDVVNLTQTGLRMYVNKEDLMADENVCGVYSFEKPQFQAMLKHFAELKADDKAFSLSRHEPATVVQSEKFPLHGWDIRIAQVKLDGLLLWIDQTGIESDLETSR